MPSLLPFIEGEEADGDFVGNDCLARGERARFIEHHGRDVTGGLREGGSEGGVGGWGGRVRVLLVKMAAKQQPPK